MKKLSILILVGLLAISTNCFSQLNINSNGYVGVNQTAPAYNLDWYGTGRFWSTGCEWINFDTREIETRCELGKLFRKII